MLASGAAGVINHLLRGEEWARSRLKTHAGKTARVRIPPLDFDFIVLEDGEIEEAGSHQVSPDVLIELLKELCQDVRIIAVSREPSQQDAWVVERGVFFYMASPEVGELVRVIEAATRPSRAANSSRART